MNKFSRVKASNKQMRNPFGELSIFHKFLTPTGYDLVDERCMDKLEYKTDNCLQGLCLCQVYRTILQITKHTVPTQQPRENLLTWALP